MGIGGIMNAISSSLRDKEENQRQVAYINREPGMIAAKASANLDTVKAGLLPGQVGSDMRKTDAEIKNLDEITRLLGPEAMAKIAYMKAQGRNLDAETGGILQDTQRRVTDPGVFRDAYDQQLSGMGYDPLGAYMRGGTSRRY